MGLDIHKSVVVATAVDGMGNRIDQRKLGPADDELTDYLRGLPGERRVAMEATTVWEHYFDAAVRGGAVPVLSNPLKTRLIAETSLKTVSSPYRVTLHPDRSTLKRSRNDLSYVMVHTEDKDGNLVPDAVAEIRFKVSGVGELAGVGSANPREMASFRLPRRKTFHGQCLVIVRPTGTAGPITIQASSEGLEPASITIHVG